MKKFNKTHQSAQLAQIELSIAKEGAPGLAIRKGISKEGAELQNKMESENK